MAWTTPKTWSTNEVVTAANMNTHLRDNMTFVGNPPRCSVFNSGVQSIANGTTVVLTANSENYDSDTMHSTVTNTSRITATTAGIYLVVATVRFAANATGFRFIEFFFNATTASTAMLIPAPTSDAVLSASRPFSFTASQFIEIQAHQTSGGALNVTLENFSATLISVT